MTAWGSISTETVCLNCKKPLAFHCKKRWHFLSCCPGTCPGDVDKNERFHPPQIPKPKREDR